MTAPPARGASRRTMLVAAAAVLVVAALTTAGGVFVFARQQPLPHATPAPSLLGEMVAMGEATHVTSAAGLQVTPGQPPAGGPHFAQPLRAGTAIAPVEDGNAIHSLEHGMIWISYRADLITSKDLATLAAVAQAHPNDVLLTPRPQNSAVASIVSWGRRATIPTPIDQGSVEAFVTTNLNQSPEPGIR